MFADFRVHVMKVGVAIMNQADLAKHSAVHRFKVRLGVAAPHKSIVLYVF